MQGQGMPARQPAASRRLSKSIIFFMTMPPMRRAEKGFDAQVRQRAALRRAAAAMTRPHSTPMIRN
jgi:hypothetical protein